MSTEAASTIAGTVWDVAETPIGELTLIAGPAGLRRINFPRKGSAELDEDRRDPDALASVREQLAEYFDGERQAFELTLDLEGQGDELARKVWTELLRIPYGETTTYGEIGKRVEHDDPRDIGTHVGATPIPIVVPCHRVIGADGSLRGYGGGLPRKEALLRLEHQASGRTDTPVWASADQLELL
jgi:methylated-DNA-[protein]-cysteine S-methyltransferase